MSDRRNYDSRVQVHHAGPNERRRARIEAAATDLLERILRRRRWSARDRDEIADFLERLVVTETKRAFVGARAAEGEE